MAYKIKPFEPRERKLFVEFPPEDENMGYGCIGRMRGEVGFFGLRHMWHTDWPPLDTKEFRRERTALIRGLRRDIFCRDDKLRAFCNSSAQPLDDGAAGFKICSEKYTFYFRCEPGRGFEGYDVTMFAYDNSLLHAELAGKHVLPERCYAVLDGELALLQPYEKPLLIFAGGTADENIKLTGELNADLGVTKAQVSAMLAGIEYGFNQPCAWPWQYDENGESRAGKAQKEHDRGAI